uniref:Uncharacterized protein n=1 Tax=Arundo donax TaxID=35708 RepID=A0A0A9BXG3_ARUDO
MARVSTGLMMPISMCWREQVRPTIFSTMSGFQRCMGTPSRHSLTWKSSLAT